MIKEKNRRDALKKRDAEEKDRLSKVYLITSLDELKGIYYRKLMKKVMVPRRSKKACITKTAN